MKRETQRERIERLKSEYAKAREIYGRDFEAKAGPNSSTYKVWAAARAWAERLTKAVTEPARIAHQAARDQAQDEYDARVAPYKQAYFNALAGGK